MDLFGGLHELLYLAHSEQCLAHIRSYCYAAVSSFPLAPGITPKRADGLVGDSGHLAIIIPSTRREVEGNASLWLLVSPGESGFG